LLQDAANARTADKLATVELAISEVGRRMVALAHQFMSGEQVARVMGKDGEPLWVQYDREYLEGDFDFEVVGGSTQPHNESFRRQSALQLVDAMAPFVQTGLVNMKELASYVLQNGFGIKNPEVFMAAPEQPMGPESPQGPPQGPQGAPMGPGGGMPPMQAGPPPDGGGMPPEMMAALQGMQGQPPI
jgi:hypothetical protein